MEFILGTLSAAVGLLSAALFVLVRRGGKTPPPDTAPAELSGEEQELLRRFERGVEGILSYGKEFS